MTRRRLLCLQTRISGIESSNRAMDFDYDLHVFHSSTFQSVVNEAIEFFAKTPIHMLPPPRQFLGPGVYALYYVGDYKIYTKIALLNQSECKQPIYVGKAVPPGWRTARTAISETSDLYLRLHEHTRSIHLAANLEVADFRCRFMVLGGIENDLIGTVEAQLIRRYRPLWNTIIDGFGNHESRRRSLQSGTIRMGRFTSQQALGRTINWRGAQFRANTW
jgi:hypothetical protein